MIPKCVLPPDLDTWIQLLAICYVVPVLGTRDVCRGTSMRSGYQGTRYLVPGSATKLALTPSPAHQLSCPQPHHRPHHPTYQRKLWSWYAHKFQHQPPSVSPITILFHRNSTRPLLHSHPFHHGFLKGGLSLCPAACSLQ